MDLLKYFRLCNIVEAYSAAAWQHDIDFVNIMFREITFHRERPSLDFKSAFNNEALSNNNIAFLYNGGNEKIYLIVKDDELILVKIIPGLFPPADEEIPQERLNAITETFKDLLNVNGFSMVELAYVE